MYFNVFRKGHIITVYVLFITSLLFLFACSLILFESFSAATLLIVLFLLFIVIGFIWLLFFGYYSSRFYIDSKGIKFIKRNQTIELKWDDIKTIELISNNPSSKSKYSYICFNSSENSQTQELDIKQYNEKYFAVQYRKEIVDEIIKYWDKPIQLK